MYPTYNTRGACLYILTIEDIQYRTYLGEKSVSEWKMSACVDIPGGRVRVQVEGVVCLRTVGTTQPLPVDGLHDVLVGLGLVRLVIF